MHVCAAKRRSSQNFSILHQAAPPAFASDRAVSDYNDYSLLFLLHVAFAGSNARAIQRATHPFEQQLGRWARQVAPVYLIVFLRLHIIFFCSPRPAGLLAQTALLKILICCPAGQWGAYPAWRSQSLPDRDSAMLIHFRTYSLLRILT